MFRLFVNFYCYKYCGTEHICAGSKSINTLKISSAYLIDYFCKHLLLYVWECFFYHISLKSCDYYFQNILKLKDKNNYLTTILVLHQHLKFLKIIHVILEHILW